MLMHQYKVEPVNETDFKDGSDFPDFSEATRIDIWHYTFSRFEMMSWLDNNTTVKRVAKYDDEKELFIFFNTNEEIEKFNIWIKDKKNDNPK